VEFVHPRYRAFSDSCVSSGVHVRSGSRLLLVSPPLAPDSSVAPPPGSPLPATPSWHALSSSCLLSPQVSTSPPDLACPPCLACVEGRQRAAPHSSLFHPTTAPLQTLHMDVWGPTRVVDVVIPWIRTVRVQLCERFDQDLPLLRLHSD
ncbi:unnamed protein product, partial [Closterium sp. NIES-53]